MRSGICFKNVVCECTHTCTHVHGGRVAVDEIRLSSKIIVEVS